MVQNEVSVWLYVHTHIYIYILYIYAYVYIYVYTYLNYVMDIALHMVVSSHQEQLLSFDLKCMLSCCCNCCNCCCCCCCCLKNSPAFFKPLLKKTRHQYPHHPISSAFHLEGHKEVKMDDKAKSIKSTGIPSPASSHGHNTIQRPSWRWWVISIWQ